MRIEEALERYLVQLQADGRSPITLGQYRRGVLLLARWAAQEGREAAVEDLGHEDLARFLCDPMATERPDGKPKKPSSMNVLRGTLKSFFAHLHRAGYLHEDPSRLIRMARCGRPVPRALSEEDCRRLFDVLKMAEGRAAERDNALFTTMLRTGVRIGSALALEVSDVDFERRTLLLREMKGGRQEVVGLPQDVSHHLLRYLNGRRTGTLFPGKHGGRLNRRTVQARLVAWAKEAGIDRRVSPHDFRHTFAVRFYSRTKDILALQQALTHTSIASTLVYAQNRTARPFP